MQIRFLGRLRVMKLGKEIKVTFQNQKMNFFTLMDCRDEEIYQEPC